VLLFNLPSANFTASGLDLDRFQGTEIGPAEVAQASDETASRNGWLYAGLNRLGELDRETLLSFYVQGHSLIEMSDEFLVPVGTIKSRMFAARGRLASQLEPHKN
jgi:DNA-directed RNA polymerase specialized sigma24 family protein